MRPLLFFLAAVNPPYLLGALPRGERRSLRAAAAAVASVIGLVAVAALAGWSGPILDALDVSPSTFRIAAGVVALGGGLVRFLDPSADPLGSDGGWRLGVIPLAFPLLLAPDVVLLAVTLGADHGVAATVGSALVALAVFVAASLVAPGRRSVVVVGASRLLAALLVVAGVVLAVDGIQDL